MNTPTLRRSLYHVYALYLIVIGSTLTQAQTPGEHISRNIKDGATMIRIPSGSFFMGTTQEEIDAQFKDTGLPIDWKQYTLESRSQSVSWKEGPIRGTHSVGVPSVTNL